MPAIASGRRSLIRAPNHLGDLVMALPALAAAPDADLQVVRWLAPLAELARHGDAAGGEPPRVLPLDRGRRGFVAGARAVRAGNYERGILLPPSLSSALLFYAGGVAERRGTSSNRRALLLTDALPTEALRGLHRAAAYWQLVTGTGPAAPLIPRLPVTREAEAAWQRALESAPVHHGPTVGIFPGSNARSRRWDASRFAEVARSLANEGVRVLVFGAAAERAITAEVAGTWGLDLGGRTSLAALAAGLAMCDVLVSNDSGPLHLAASVGTSTVSLWGAGDPGVTGPAGGAEPARHVLLRHPELPCVPCVKNDCRRRGSAGYVLPDADRECIRITTPDAVLALVRRQLDGAATASAPLLPLSTPRA